MTFFPGNMPTDHSIAAPSDRPCAIIVPVYKSTASPLELRSLEQAVSVLNSYPIFFIAPGGLDVALYLNVAPMAQVIRLPPHHFESIAAYSRLLLCQDFYEIFAQWRYILIYQLDAWVFRDELAEWCHRGYAYIGAPWYGVRTIGAGCRISRGVGTRMLLHGRLRNLVGNGGLSLRHVRLHREVLINYPTVASSWTTNEDGFWSIFAPFCGARFPVPHWKEAAHFALEVAPRSVSKRAGVILPFGCHAWERYDKHYWTARGVG